MTPEDRLERVTRLGGSSRLALVYGDTVLDPMIGEPFASMYRRAVLEEFRAAIAEEREACALIVELVLQVKAKDGTTTSKALVDVLHDAARITAAAIRGRP